ncbi:hypothetical protein H0R92_09895 [Treponema sp. OMZ 840]|uniref:hypothetical protein n=1 Tax=Treponema sp. OMZ 840 TaxID=244313 RepID=UPI003D8C213E
MKYTVKILTLYKNLCYATESGLPLDKTDFLYSYTCAVQNNDLSPRRSRFLTKPRFEGYALSNAKSQESGTGLLAGRYFFLQAPVPQECIMCKSAEAEKKRLAEYRLAAEYMYTEAIWNEIDFCDDKIYIRTLTEDNAAVFQLFRKIGTERHCASL